MDIKLSPETEQLIQQELERGEYENASELVSTAIHQLRNVRNNETGHSAAGLPDFLIGVFDSSKEPPSDKHRDPLAELVADKLQKQGITAPWRR